MLASINAANSIRWALSNLPDGYVYHDFHSGYAVCQDITSKKYGAIDTNGEIAIPVVYDYMGDFNGDATNVKTNEGEGIIGFDNKYLLLPDARYTIIPITTETDGRKQTFKNSFLVTNTSDSTQAIFYKDKFITDFTPNHSLSYDVQFPFISMKDGYIINTESEDTLSFYLDMGSYYLAFYKKEIYAISHLDGTDITPYVIGEDINIADAQELSRQIQMKIRGEVEPVSIELFETLKKQNENNAFICSISHDNGIWNITNHAGKVKHSLKDEDGWTCNFPFFQNGVVWFERNLQNTDSTELKIVNISGLEVFSKTISRNFNIELFPSHMNTMGYTMTLHNTPFIFITENFSDGLKKRTTVCYTLDYKDIYTFDNSNIMNYRILGDYMCYRDMNSNCFIYDIKKRKHTASPEFDVFWENVIITKNEKGQYAIFSKGKTSTIKKYSNIHNFNEGVAIAISSNGNVIIDTQGKDLLQDNNDFKIVGIQSSENVILAIDKKTSKYGYIYNPLIKDTLIYNATSKKEQLYAQAMNYYNEKKYNKARNRFASLYRHEPNNDDYLVKYADCMTAQKYYVAAINKYNKALELNPTNQEAAEHLAIAQNKKEREEEIRAIIYGIASSVNDALESTAQALNVSTSSASNNENHSNASDNSATTSSQYSNSSSSRNDAMYWNADKKTYSDYETQLIKMNTYYETQYNDNDRRYLQSQMRSIRTKWESRGYKMFHSPWEEWDGRKR